MKQLLPFMSLLLVLCRPVLAQTAAEREVMDTEKKRFQAMVDRDFAVLEEVIDSDLYYIHSNGSTDTKETFIGGFRDGSRSYENITIQDLKARIYNKKTAILNSTCTYHRTGEDGQPNNLRLLYTNVYVKRNGKWQMVTWQSHRL
ncbi:hypothetical protein BH24BAC1_BH24BAC1_19520 [soil metagenome]